MSDEFTSSKAQAELYEARTGRQLCRCGHGIAVHDLNRKGERTACFVIIGAKGIRCLCKSFWPERHEPAG